MFATIVNAMGDNLLAVILEGMSDEELKNYVLQPCVAFLAKQDVRFSYKTMDAIGLDRYWTQMQNHYAVHGEGSILLSISGSYEHWTCVKKITKRCIVLADSGHLRRLYRARVTVGSPTRQRSHTLTPAETFLISATHDA